MNDWAAGYVTDVDYTLGYYTELNPLRIRLAFINAGLVFPEVGTACELGYGQGLSINAHAAAAVVEWHGTDFNPSQAGFARELAKVTGANTKLHDQSFSEFCVRDDLPDFDFIALHGIWSWVSDANRQIIIDFIQRKLKVGGVLYVSYNAMPAWAATVPMRDLLTEHAELMSVTGDNIIKRIDAALGFAERLFEVGAGYARANPIVSERLKKLKGQDRQYLAHEYFNKDWHPMPFSRMREWLRPTKLEYACSAHYLDHLNVLNLNAEQQAFLGEIENPGFRETVRDFMVNQQFRRDYWVKGARRLTVLERSELLQHQRVILLNAAKEIKLKVEGSLGEANLKAETYGPIIESLADQNPHMLGDVEKKLKDMGIGLVQLMEAVLILLGKGDLAPAQDEKVVAKAKPLTDKLNQHLMIKARSHAALGFLVSPVTGGAIPVNRLEMLFLLAYQHGRKQATEMASYAWDVFALQGQRLVKDGKALITPEENLEEIKSKAKPFAEQRIAVLKALGIA